MVDFSLGGLSTALADQRNRTIARQQQETATTVKKATLSAAAARESNVVTHQSIDSANESRGKQLEMYGTLDETLNIAKEGMRLSDSSDPMDRLKLWMLQQSDSRYTAEGNSRRLAYLRDAAGTLATSEVINQQGFADKMTEIQSDLSLSTMTDDNDLATLKLAETQGQELIDAHLNEQVTMANTMLTRNSMQQAVLANMTPEQTDAALQQAMNSDSGSVNIGGIDLSQALIQDRSAALKDRAYTVTVQQATAIDTQLSNLTVDQTQMKLAESRSSKDGFTEINGVRISSARLEDRLSILQSRDTNVAATQLAMSQTLKSVADDNMVRYASTLSLPELDKVIQNGGKIPEMGGQQLSLERLQSIRDTKFAAQNNALTMQMATETVSNPMQTVVDYSQYLSSLKSNLPAGSPVLKLIDNQTTLNNVAAGFIKRGADAGPAGQLEMLHGIQAVQANRDTMEAALTQEAARLGGGDKKREEALNYQLRGQMIPEHVVIEGITERVQKNDPIGDWLSPQSAGVFNVAYRDALAQVNQQDVMGAQTTAQKQAQAAALAFEATKTSIAGGMTEEIMSIQLDPAMADLKSPLLGFVKPQQFISMMHDSDVAGANRYQQATGASNEDMQRYAAGEGNPELAATQAAQLLINLEKVKPGLGQAYVDWWSSPQRQALATRYSTAKNNDAVRTGFTKSVEMGLVLPTLQSDMSGYASTLFDAAKQTVSNELAAQHTDFVTFGNDATAKQAFLLQMDQTLTPTQKKAAMDGLIAPVLAAAAQQGKTPEEATLLVEQALRTAKPEDPALRSLQQTILKNRDQALSVVDSFIQVQNIRQNPARSGIGSFIGTTLTNAVVGDPIQREARGFEWMK